MKISTNTDKEKEEEEEEEREKEKSRWELVVSEVGVTEEPGDRQQDDDSGC